MRILYIQATLVPPPTDQLHDRFLRLSRDLEGDILQPVWFRTPDEIEALFGPGSYPVYTVGRFRYHWYLAYTGPLQKSRFSVFAFYLREGIRLCRERKPDCIVVYSHLTTALCGVVLKFLCGVRFIPEVMIGPERAYLTDSPQPTFKDRVRHFYSDLCLHLTAGLSNCVHLLYPEQLDSYPLLRNRDKAVFHDYTPLSSIHAGGAEPDNQVVILAGAPWYRKGVDLAIQAFKRLAGDYPHARLQIIGHYPDGVPGVLAQGCPQIEIFSAIEHEQLMRMVSECAIVIVPSRNEGLPRILIEATMAGRPVIGSRVAGIPVLIKDGENGFLINDGDDRALEQMLRKLLSDPDLRRTMGQRSRDIALSSMTEEIYVREFTAMVERTAVQRHAAE